MQPSTARAAIGQHDAYAGELPFVYVTPKAGGAVDEQALLAFVAPRVGEPTARPKSISILAEMPVTSIGKIYKPARRMLATRRAIEETLGGIVLASLLFQVAVNENESVVRLKDVAYTDAVRGALLGMPIRYRIQPTPKADPALTCVESLP